MKQRVFIALVYRDWGGDSMQEFGAGVAWTWDA
jgi:hypothetical protein